VLFEHSASPKKVLGKEPFVDKIFAECSLPAKNVIPVVLVLKCCESRTRQHNS
jgi:hypothetical protein